VTTMSIERTPFDDALAQMRQRAIDPDRAGRAEEVRATYKIEELTPGLYMVQHPIEDERSYLVDSLQDTCECPDFGCRANHEGFACKHLIAVYALTGKPMSVDRTYAVDAWIDRSRRLKIILRISTSAKTTAAKLLLSQFRALGGAWDKRWNGWVFDASDRIAASIVHLCPRAKTDRDFSAMVARFSAAVDAGKTEPIGDIGYKAGYRERDMNAGELERHFGMPISDIKDIFERNQL